MIDPKDLPTPPGFRMRKLPKKSGGFRYVFTYTSAKKTKNEYELRRAHEAEIKHELLLGKVSTNMHSLKAGIRNVPIGWRWKRDDLGSRKLFQEAEDSYFGEVRFCSPLEYVEDHLVWGGGPYFMKLDFKNAFGSVTYDRFVEFTNDGWWKRKGKVREIPLSQHIYRGWPFFHKQGGGLIQGAPTSPYLFERYCLISGFDGFLREYAWRNKFVITRYVDDVIISSSRPFGSKVRGTLRRAFNEWGFEINAAKSGTINTNKHPLKFLGVVLYKGKVKTTPEFWDGVHENGLTPPRLAWLNAVAKLNL